MLPAYEHLDARDGSCLEIYLWLVVQQQLLAFKSVSQMPFQGLALYGLETDVGFKELVIVAPTSLGVIHRRVGILDQRLRLFTVDGGGASAHADSVARAVCPGGV